jgi:hypothetical protein
MYKVSHKPFKKLVAPFLLLTLIISLWLRRGLLIIMCTYTTDALLAQRRRHLRANIRDSTREFTY